MALRLTTTKKAIRDGGVKIAVYGYPGVGKTRLCATTGVPSETLIISAEAGLLSVQECDIPVAEVSSIDDLMQIYNLILNDPSFSHFKWICLDSVSEIAEVCLSEIKSVTPDGRQSYGIANDKMVNIFRMFRDLPNKNVYFSAHVGSMRADETMGVLTGPGMPGKTLGPKLTHIFDEVFFLRSFVDDNKEKSYWLVCHENPQNFAKDRSGALNEYEEPNLAMIAEKIKSRNNLLKNDEIKEQPAQDAEEQD